MEKNNKNGKDRAWFVIDQNLRALNDIESRLDKIEAEKQKAIEKAVARALKSAAASLKRKARLEADTTERVEKLKEKLLANGSKSRKLNYGTVGYRKAVRIEFLEGWDELKAIQKLNELYSGNKFFQKLSDKLDQDKRFIKSRQELDLLAIKNSSLTDDELAQFGCRRVVYDRAYYKTLYSAMKDNEDGTNGTGSDSSASDQKQALSV